MQTIHQNEDKKEYSGRASTLNFDVYTGRIDRYVKRKHIGRSRIRKLEVCISKGVVGSIEKRI